MATFLFDKIIFGPVQSRRLGVSLGINLISPASKHCNFNCIYCECGWNEEHPGGHFNSPDSVISRLEGKLTEMKTSGQLPNYITFAGNGEPTMHPQFSQIIDRTIESRNKIAPTAKIAVLTNATMIDRPEVHSALLKIERNILKFDSAIESTQKLLNKANIFRTIAQQIELLKSFNGTQVIQTMFIKGNFEGVAFDNSSEIEVNAWLEALRQIMPKEVMLYTIDRDTPAAGLEKISKETLATIALKVEALGIKATY